jgi:hypothetical protein
MKMKLFAVIASGTAVAALCLAGVCFRQTAGAQTESVPPPAPQDSAAPDAPDESAALPPNIDTNSALAQIVKLIQSGVSEDVIMTYVTNSTSTFNLDPDKIVYLKDIGAPDDLVTAMMQRDQVLQAQLAAGATYRPPQPAAPAAETVVTAPAPAVTVVEPAAPVTVDYFNDTLAPYGSWVYVSGYGRCWRPTVTVVNAGWQPYSDHGHWVWTDCGWYWISDYSWGWAPFHYGRWFCDTRLGWCWYPDTVWGPSWVTWRYSANYCGWAPLPPHAVYRAGVGFFYNGAAVSVGFNFGLGVSAYTFVPTGNFCDPHPWHYRVPPTHVTQIYNNTTIINNFNEDAHNRRFINHGIDPQHITEVTHAPIRPVAIHETTMRGPRGEQFGRDGQTLYVNRPRFSDNPPPAGRGELRPAQPRPAMGSASSGSHNDIQNNNPSSSRNRQPAPAMQPPPNRSATPRPAAAPPVGSAYQGRGSHNGGPNNNPFPSRNDQPVQTTPPSGQRPFSTPAAANPSGRSQTTTVQPSPAPGFNRAPITPGQPATPNRNFNNSTDNRRYPSPRMQAPVVQNPPVNQGNNSGRTGAALPTPVPPARQPGATPFVPPAQSAVPAAPQPQQRSYAAPRNEPSPGGSRANSYQPPAAGNQPSSGSLQHSSAPTQSQSSGRGRNQNGQ